MTDLQIAETVPEEYENRITEYLSEDATADAEEIIDWQNEHVQKTWVADAIDGSDADVVAETPHFVVVDETRLDTVYDVIANEDISFKTAYGQHGKQTARKAVNDMKRTMRRFAYEEVNGEVDHIGDLLVVFTD